MMLSLKPGSLQQVFVWLSENWKSMVLVTLRKQKRRLKKTNMKDKKQALLDLVVPILVTAG